MFCGLGGWTEAEMAVVALGKSHCFLYDPFLVTTHSKKGVSTEAVSTLWPMLAKRASLRGMNFPPSE